MMLENFGTRGTIVEGSKTKTVSVLTELMEQYPEQVWDKVSKYLKPREHFERKVTLEKWLKGEDLSDLTFTEEENGAITLVPWEKISEWIEEDMKNRVGYFAFRLVPITLSTEKWQTSLARKVLVYYGERENVRINLLTNYSFSEPWTGNLSSNLDAKRQKLLCIRESEDDIHVKQWLGEYIEKLQEDIEQEKINEEREF